MKVLLMEFDGISTTDWPSTEIIRGIDSTLDNQ